MALRVPYDQQYAARLGAAVYVFAWYEWAVIHLIEQFETGFLAQYCRGKPMTSGNVKGKLDALLDSPTTSYEIVSRLELEDCCRRFERLIQKRNALIHAHPMTDVDGSQVLSYQSSLDRALPDMNWPLSEVDAVHAEFDAAGCATNELLQRFLSHSNS